MGQSSLKYKRVFSNGTDPSIPDRLIVLENNLYEITYFEEVSTPTGTITKPVGSTIKLDQLQGGVDAYVTTIASGQPTGEFPKTAGGITVDVTSFDALGNYILSGIPNAYPVAIIYVITIPALSLANADPLYRLDLQDLGKEPGILPASSTTVWHGNKTWSKVVEDDMLLDNNITNNVSLTKHGFMPILSGNSLLFFDGNGNQSTPTAGVANSYKLTAFSGQTSVTVTHGFGTYPAVSVAESSGYRITPLNIKDNSTNDFTVTFSVATSGYIISTVGSPQPQNVIVVSNDYTVLNTDKIIEVNAANKTITLPTAIGNAGREFNIVNDSTGSIYVTGVETVDGLITQTLSVNSAVSVYSNGTNYKSY